MPEPALQQVRDAPSFKVFAGGSALPPEAQLDILDLRVSDYVEGAGVFSITFNNWNSDKQVFKYSDDTLLAEGTRLEVKAGYVDNLTSLIVGDITALEPEFSESEAPTLRVTGYDSLHRFRRGRKTRSFTTMKDSEIAQKIASDLQLSAQTDDSSVTHDYVLQDNLTDIDFLLTRARRIRFEVVVSDKTLYFRKAANDKDKVVSLDFGLTLKSFYPRLSTMQQVSQVIVQGWDPKSKSAITANAAAGDETTRMGGSKLGVSITDAAFFATKTYFVEKPVASASEAMQIAKAKFNDMTMDFITGEGSAIGNTSIRAGAVVELKGLGQRYSGLYYVTSSTHVVDKQGYTTRFTVGRNAL